MSIVERATVAKVRRVRLASVVALSSTGSNTAKNATCCGARRREKNAVCCGARETVERAYINIANLYTQYYNYTILCASIYTILDTELYTIIRTVSTELYTIICTVSTIKYTKRTLKCTKKTIICTKKYTKTTRLTHSF